jgi:hypothetical protein
MDGHGSGSASRCARINQSSAERAGSLAVNAAAFPVQVGLGSVLSGFCCAITLTFWNGRFRASLPFVFSEIEGMICEGFPNSSGGDLGGSAVSKGSRRRSMFNTLFETWPVRFPPELNSGSVTGCLAITTSVTAGHRLRNRDRADWQVYPRHPSANSSE